ncbi:MAG: flagellar hook-length control protein FliK [Desulfobulbaceae bacterium]|nr:flagellar hook-length control protein FliK [Desulfobulbaceae bacterium]
MDITLKQAITGPAPPTETTGIKPAGVVRQFVTGQIIAALISGRKSDGKYILDFGKTSFAASSKIPLRIGQEILLQVTDTSSRTTLKILPSQFTDTIIKGLPLFNAQTNLLPQLAALQKKIVESPLFSQSSKDILQLFTSSYNSATPPLPDGKTLQIIADKTGFHHERQLAAGDKTSTQASLKNALLEIASKADKNGEVSSKALQLVELIEFQQQINGRLGEQSLFFLPLVFPFLQQGYVLFDNEQSSSEDEENTTHTHSINLKLEGLGNLEIIMKLTGSHLTLSFLTEDEEKAAFLESQRNELMEHLTAIIPDSVNFVVGAEDCETKLLRRIIPQASGGVLNTQV